MEKKFNILVFNCGSSSLTYKVFEVRNSQVVDVVLSGKCHRVGVKGSELSFIETLHNGEVNKEVFPIRNHEEAASLVFKFIETVNLKIDYIGHRFVHGGTFFQSSAYINDANLTKLKLCRPLAPIHNPNSLSVINKSKRIIPKVTQYVTFDSSFHSTLPDYAYTYALPKSIMDKYEFRKYGFHGLSFQYVIKEASKFLKLPLNSLKIVACHLGTGGSSVVAVNNGCSLDTSLGFSPLPGLVMSTRSGDIDPMLAIYLMTTYGYRSEDLMEMLSERSGLLGISGFSSDIRDIIKKFSESEVEEGQAELAFNMYVHRLKKYIGSFIVALRGIDVLIFTDDIGVHNWLVREKVCENMEWIGLLIDKEANHKVLGESTSLISSIDSSVKVLTIPTEEELVICEEGIKLIRETK